MRRRRVEHSYRKLAISVPAELMVAVEKQVHANQAASVSAFFAGAAQEKLLRDHLQDLLDRTWKKAPMTEAEREWADKILEG